MLKRTHLPWPELLVSLIHGCFHCSEIDHQISESNSCDLINHFYEVHDLDVFSNWWMKKTLLQAWTAPVVTSSKFISIVYSFSLWGVSNSMVHIWSQHAVPADKSWTPCLAGRRLSVFQGETCWGKRSISGTMITCWEKHTEEYHFRFSNKQDGLCPANWNATTEKFKK